MCLGFPGDSAGKESACNVGDLGSMHGLGRSPGEGKGYPLPYSGLENSMDCIVFVVADSDTTKRLSLHWVIQIGRQGWESLFLDFHISLSPSIGSTFHMGLSTFSNKMTT